MKTQTMQKFSYESLVKDYETNLETQTRGFSAGLPWLETWVPDDDVIASINNLIEAAQNGGIDSLALSVKIQTLKLLSEKNLAAHFSHLGKIFIRSSEAEVIIEISDLQKAMLFSDVRDYYKTELRQRHDNLRFSLSAPHNSIGCENQNGCLWLQLGQQEPLVRGAGFLPSPSCAPSLVSAMDMLCEIINGLPLHEVREHAIVKLEYRLRDPEKKPPVQGIILPQNADSIFLKVRELLIGCLQKTEVYKVREANFFDSGPNKNWIARSPNDREMECQQAVDSASIELLGYEKGIRIIDAHKPYAVTIKFEGDAGVGVKRKAALAIEKILRRVCDPRLEVFCLEMKDASQLRRL
jgi:hypothetical protein